MTLSEFNEICRLVCKHCAANKEPTQRRDTREWTHSWTERGRGGTTIYHHSICGANGLRNSHFVKELTGG